MKCIPTILFCGVSMVAAACGDSAPVAPGGGSKSSSQPPLTSPASPATSQPTLDPATPSDPLATPESAFAHILDRLRALDVDGLKACMVESSRDQVVLEDLEVAKAALGSAPASDIGPDIEISGAVATVRQKSSAKLCELHFVGGRWYAAARFWRTKSN